MNPEHIWLIAGYAGSGKDVTADLLTDILGKQNVTRSAFADAVKDEVATLYNLDRASLDTQEGKARVVRCDVCHRDAPRGHIVRNLLIEHAETTKQKEGLAVWAEKLQAPHTTHWILSDWRFMEELVALRTRFPCAILHTLRVHRPSVEPSRSHTEHELDDFKYQYKIENSGSLLYIGTQLMEIVDTLQPPTGKSSEL